MTASYGNASGLTSMWNQTTVPNCSIGNGYSSAAAAAAVVVAPAAAAGNFLNNPVNGIN